MVVNVAVCGDAGRVSAARTIGVHDGLDSSEQQSRRPHWLPQFIGSLENWPAMKYGGRVRTDLSPPTRDAVKHDTLLLKTLKLSRPAPASFETLLIISAANFIRTS